MKPKDCLILQVCNYLKSRSFSVIFVSCRFVELFVKASLEPWAWEFTYGFLQ